MAHHSNAAQFDSTKRQTIKGEITKVEWTNPHAYIHVAVKDAAGKVTNWQLEGFPPNTLLRTGWSQKDLKQGDVITVEGALARDGSAIMLAREVILVDGRKLYWGPAA
jgi:hydrogenase maturation factor